MELSSENFVEAVHAVLGSWHAGDFEELPWRDMLVVRQHVAQQLVPNLDLAVKKTLLEGLNTLDGQGRSSATEILRLRFFDGLTGRMTANRINSTENVVYKQQRAALQQLAAVVAQAERDVRFAKAAQVLERLEIQEPPHLFGIDDKLTDLTNLLTAEGPPWLSGIVGIGGIGKTSLADAAVRSLAAGPAFANVAWVSARQDRFTFSGGVEPLDPRPALTFEGLVEAVAEQFDFRDLARLPLPGKRSGLQARLKALPYLIVVDNLETAADYHALVPELQSLVNPTRFLLTSRHSLHEYPGVHNVNLDELSADDSAAMLRHEARERGLADVADASDASLLQLYEVAGGNPLALKLLLGQMHTLSLPKVVDDLREARGRTVEELYRFIYWRSWNLISDAARQLLTIMPLVAESGGGLEQIAELGMLTEERFTFALKQLVTFSLVNVRGTVEARRYSVHRLTETFLLNEVLKWQTPS